MRSRPTNVLPSPSRVRTSEECEAPWPTKSVTASMARDVPSGTISQATSTDPVVCDTWVRRSNLPIEKWDWVSSQTGRHGPTAAAGGDQPGVRPRSVVRSQRSCWCWIIGARHLGRGRFISRNGSSARNRMSSSLSSLSSSVTGHR